MGHPTKRLWHKQEDAQCIAQLADEEIKRCEKEYGCTVVGYIKRQRSEDGSGGAGEQQRQGYGRLLSPIAECEDELKR
ncbi:hypothetical protein FJT64_021136 [Amphibalanus amphitrite]|uniref:Uncharacterized protein n=1 Tax=Amphibalanus amphitrite TaxID=1232801 RepID=A0A6A4WUN2_AMPAM|nr:hypothetical protein FJT64_021136 [Amphibalanus amphitrite]